MADCALSGSGPQTMSINVTLSSQNAGANQSTYLVQLIYHGNNWGSWTNNTQSWSVTGSASASGTFTIPQPGTGDILLYSAYWTWNHDGNGNLNWGVTGNISTNHSTIGSGSCGVSGSAPRLGQAPGAPGNPTYSAITPTSCTLSWTAAARGRADITNYQWQMSVDPNYGSQVAAPLVGVVLTDNTANDATLAGNTLYYTRVRALNGDGWGGWSGSVGFYTAPGAPGSPTASNVTPTGLTWSWAAPSGNGTILEYQVRYSTDPTFATGVTTVSAGTALSYSPTGLTPGNTYYVQVQARNQSGWGTWSATGSQTTLPSTAPGLSVSADASGRSATATMSPPGGATGVTNYTVEYRIGTGASTSVDSPTTTVTITGLTPGTTYQWRASAWFGSYQSPTTNWVSLTQPNPNTNPGDYFDGSTAAKPDTTYAWSGTANLSTSKANGVAPDGWMVEVGSGAAILQRVTGGFAGSFSARATVTTDITTGVLSLGGTYTPIAKMAAVQGGSSYIGSIYARPSKAQRLAAKLYWFTAAGALISGSAAGTAAVVQPGGFVQLVSPLVAAPSNAAYAIVRAEDVTGTGHVAWLGGDYLDADAAMVTLGQQFPYFDGDTADSPAYNYAWLGTANASVSARNENVVSPIDPLADPDCPPLPTPPALPVIDSDCIDETGTWRRYTVAVPASEVRQWSSTLPTLILSTGPTAVRQVRIRYYENPNALPDSQAATGSFDSEMILTYIPPNTQMTLDGVTEQVSASVAGAPTISGNRLLYGTGGVPATWPELRCGIGYVIALDVPLDAPTGNLSTRLVLTQRL